MLAIALMSYKILQNEIVYCSHKVIAQTKLCCVSRRSLFVKGEGQVKLKAQGSR
jgi:hypothetical protein